LKVVYSWVVAFPKGVSFSKVDELDINLIFRQ
jgi:hypothetical protein